MLVALVEPAIGMHRAADRVVVLGALPYLWPYCLTHEVSTLCFPNTASTRRSINWQAIS